MLKMMMRSLCKCLNNVFPEPEESLTLVTGTVDMQIRFGYDECHFCIGMGCGMGEQNSTWSYRLHRGIRRLMKAVYVYEAGNRLSF
jgi:hypothetical protein